MDNKTAITYISHITTDCPRIVGLCSSQSNFHNSRVSTRGIQSRSRLGVSTLSRFERLEVEPPSVSSTEHPVGPLGSGFICQPNKHPIGVFCELVPRSVCQSNRCLPDPLVRSERLLLSTVLSDLPVLGKDQEGQGNPCDDHSSLVNTSLVSSFTGNVLQTTHIITSSSGLANITQTASTSSCATRQSAVSSLDGFRSAILAEGVSEQTASYLAPTLGATAQQLLTIVPGHSGVAGFLKNKLIRFAPLWPL